jgi:hypothetical protein
MLPRYYRLTAALFLLPALMLACRLSGRMPADGARVPVSQEAADRLEQKLRESVHQDEGTFDLEITDAELTSYVVLEMSQQIGGPEEMPVEDLQVRFADGQMICTGKLTAFCPFRLNLGVVASARVEDSQFAVTLNKAQVGVVPLPKWMRRILSRIVSESIVEAPERMERAAEITDVQIGEGVMQISGRITERSR